MMSTTNTQRTHTHATMNTNKTVADEDFSLAKVGASWVSIGGSSKSRLEDNVKQGNPQKSSKSIAHEDFPELPQSKPSSKSNLVRTTPSTVASAEAQSTSKVVHLSSKPKPKPKKNNDLLNLAFNIR